MKHIKTTFSIIVCICILLCGCTKNSSGAKIPENSLGFTTEEQIEHAAKIVKETEDTVGSAKDVGDPPSQSFIDLAKETIQVPKIILDLNIEEKPEVVANDYGTPQSTKAAVEYFNKLFGPEDEFIKYKSYAIGWLSSSVYKEIPEYEELGSGYKLSEYNFENHKVIADCMFNPETQRLGVNLGIYHNEHTLIAVIMYINGEKEMTQKLAEQLYEDFRGIPIQELKDFNQ